MDMVSYIILMVDIMMGNGNIIKWREGVHYIHKIEKLFMLVIGNLIGIQDMEYYIMNKYNIYRNLLIIQI